MEPGEVPGEGVGDGNPGAVKNYPESTAWGGEREGRARRGSGTAPLMDSWGHCDELDPFRRLFLDCGMLLCIRSLEKCLVKYLLSI